MNEMGLLNQPVEFKVGADTIKVKAISTLKRRAVLQSWLLGQLVSEIRDKAALLHSSEEEKAAYIKEEMRNLPTGQALYDTVSDLHPSYSTFVRLLCACTDLTEQQLESMLDKGSSEEVQVLMTYVYDVKKKV